MGGPLADLPVGTIVVVRTNGWVARLIRGFTDSDFNHALVIDHGRLIEADPGGVQPAPLSKYDGAHMAWLLPETPVAGELIADAARAMLGIPYGFLDIACILLSASGIVPEPVWHRLERGDRLICSQACARAFRAAMRRALIAAKADCRVTPGDIGRLIAGLPIPADK